MPPQIMSVVATALPHACGEVSLMTNNNSGLLLIPKASNKSPNPACQLTFILWAPIIP